MLDPAIEALASRIADRVADMLRENPPPAPASPWLNSQEAADYLGLSTKTLEAYRLKGTGPVWVSRGRKVRRYHVKALSEWLASGAGE